MFQQFFAGLLFAVGLLSLRRDAQLQFMRLQLKMLKARLKSDRVVPTPEEKSELLRLGASLHDDISDLIAIVKPETYRKWRVQSRDGKVIDRTFRSLPDRDHRAMAGLSMGSRQAMQIALRNLDKFSWIGLFSGATINGDLGAGYNGMFKNGGEFNKRVHLLWMGAGTAETRLMDSLKASDELLDKKGIRHVIFTSEGTAHEWQSWRRHLNDFAPRLFQGNDSFSVETAR